MSKQSNGGPVGPQKQKVTRTDLRRHSPVLYRALRALQRKHPDLTSEQLWKAVQDNWTREELNRTAASYARTNRLTAFSKLIAKATEVLPQAGPDGFFEADGEEWGTVEGFARRFKISWEAITSRCGRCRSRKGKIQGNIYTFYALSDMREACSDLLKRDEFGFFPMDGELWGSRCAFRKKFGITVIPSSKRFRACRSRKVTMRGDQCSVYALSDVKRACADFPTGCVPKAGRDGCFCADGEVWGTRGSLAKRLGLGSKTILSRLASCRSQTGELRGKYLPFYALSDVTRTCADLLQDVQKPNKKGFFKADGEQWGTIGALRKNLGIADSTIVLRLGACRSRKGRDRRNRPQTFYALSDVKRACADLLAKKKRAA